MTVINGAVRIERDGAVAVLVVDNPPVNALSHALRAGIAAGLDQAIAAVDVRAVVILCEGPTFIAGADIKELGQPPREPVLAALLAEIEGSPKPVIAALHGTALGGGFELAMACHYRIALASAKVGLPEIKLGLIPGAGGTQRLPRLVGLAQALALILSGEPLAASAAKDFGAIDAVIDGDLRGAAVAFARRILAEGREAKRARDRFDKLPSSEEIEPIIEAARASYGRKAAGQDAFEAALTAGRIAATMPFEEGVAQERALFVKLLSGTQSKARRHLFKATRLAAKIPDIPAETPTIDIEAIGIVGAGTMGAGIATAFILAGLPVTLVETSQAALDRGVSTIEKAVEAAAAKGRIAKEEAKRRTAMLSASLTLEELGGCDLVIEAVFEDMAVKRDLFGRLDAIAKPGAILASNTSYLDLNAIAAATARPEAVIGLHFFSPAFIMPLIEVVRGERTSKAVVATAMKLARTIGKTAVLSGVCHGFIGNRMLAVRQREANKLILEGAMPWDVDRVLTKFGMPMGPFQMADLAGLDLGWTRAASRGETVRERLCEADRRGQKTRAGFYDYDEQRKPTPSAVTEALVLETADRLGIARCAMPDEEILERCLYPMVDRGARILDEGIALRASDIDVVWTAGYGWPAVTGGPMFWADTIGLGVIVDRLSAFEARWGPDFTPAAHLVRLAESGGRFIADA